MMTLAAQRCDARHSFVNEGKGQGKVKIKERCGEEDRT